jgi:hypothetical protein
VENIQLDLISANTAHTLMASGGSRKKVLMVKIQSFQADRPSVLDRVAEEWLARQSVEFRIISFSKYCTNDGRKHFCSFVYEILETSTETSSPSKK